MCCRKPVVCMKKEQRIISYLYLSIRCLYRKINKYLMSGYFLFILTIKKGKEVMLRHTFLTLLQFQRTLRPIKLEEIASTQPVPEKEYQLTDFEKFTADKPWRACTKTPWMQQSFISINNVPMTSWPCRADHKKRRMGKKIQIAKK